MHVVCVCVCMRERERQHVKWLGHQPGDQKVPGLIPMQLCHFGVWLGHQPGDQKVPGLIPMQLCHFGVVVSLSKKLYSHCSSLPSC